MFLGGVAKLSCRDVAAIGVQVTLTLALCHVLRCFSLHSSERQRLEQTKRSDGSNGRSSA